MMLPINVHGFILNLTWYIFGKRIACPKASKYDFIGKSVMTQLCKAKSWIYHAMSFTQEGSILSRAEQVLWDAPGIQWVE